MEPQLDRRRRTTISPSQLLRHNLEKLNMPNLSDAGREQAEKKNMATVIERIIERLQENEVDDPEKAAQVVGIIFGQEGIAPQFTDKLMEDAIADGELSGSLEYNIRNPGQNQEFEELAQLTGEKLDAALIEGLNQLKEVVLANGLNPVDGKNNLSAQTLRIFKIMLSSPKYQTMVETMALRKINEQYEAINQRKLVYINKIARTDDYKDKIKLQDLEKQLGGIGPLGDNIAEFNGFIENLRNK